jgi:hypothetical protein
MIDGGDDAWKFSNRFWFFSFQIYSSAVRLEKVSVLSGRTAELPCDISPPPLDSLYLVLWYKNNSDFPIYK